MCTPAQIFIDRIHPSQIDRNYCAWVSVSNPSYIGTHSESTLDLQTYHDKALADIDIALAEGRSISTAEKKKAIQTILELATNDSNTCGKWLLFRNNTDVDRDWATVADLVSKLLNCLNKIVFLLLV